MRRFTLLLLIIASALTALAWALESALGSPSWLKWLPWAFAAVNLGAFAWLERTERRRPNRYVPVFMGAMSVKMFLVMGLLAVYMLQVPEHKYVVGLSAMAMHFIFLAAFTVTGYNRARGAGGATP